MSYTRQSNVSLIGHHCLPGWSFTNYDLRTRQPLVFSQSLLYSSQCCSFEWQWQYNRNVLDLPGRSQILIGDATRTSILTINKLRYTDIGNYTCQAKHSTSSANETRKIELHLTDILNRCS